MVSPTSLAAALTPSQSVHENMVIVLLTRTMIKDLKRLAFHFSLCFFTRRIEIYVFNKLYSFKLLNIRSST